MGSMVGIGRSARLMIARDKLDIDRFGSTSRHCPMDIDSTIVHPENSKWAE